MKIRQKRKSPTRGLFTLWLNDAHKLRTNTITKKEKLMIKRKVGVVINNQIAI